MTAFETRQVIAQEQSIVEKTAEKSTEKTTENKSTGSSSPIQAGTLSTIPHQATMHYCGESAIRLSNAPLLAPLLASLLASQLASQLASLPGHIHYAGGMVATGQG